MDAKQVGTVGSSLGMGKPHPSKRGELQAGSSHPGKRKGS
jgi:hypothetical protein